LSGIGGQDGCLAPEYGMSGRTCLPAGRDKKMSFQISDQNKKGREEF